MHSSRMRTARLLPVSPSMHCSVGGGVTAWSCGVYLVGVYLPGGVCTRGCTYLVLGVGGYLPGPGGVNAWSRGGVPAQVLIPLDRIPDTRF